MYDTHNPFGLVPAQVQDPMGISVGDIWGAITGGIGHIFGWGQQALPYIKGGDAIAAAIAAAKDILARARAGGSGMPSNAEIATALQAIATATGKTVAQVQAEEGLTLTAGYGISPNVMTYAALGLGALLLFRLTERRPNPSRRARRRRRSRR